MALNSIIRWSTFSIIVFLALQPNKAFSQQDTVIDIKTAPLYESKKVVINLYYSSSIKSYFIRICTSDGSICSPADPSAGIYYDNMTEDDFDYRVKGLFLNKFQLVLDPDPAINKLLMNNIAKNPDFLANLRLAYMSTSEAIKNAKAAKPAKTGTVKKKVTKTKKTPTPTTTATPPTKSR